MADTDPFRQHLVALLSIYALGPLSAPFPKYDGPTNWETSSILRSLEEFSKRLYAAEHALKVSGVYAREKQALPVTEESDVEPILKHRPSGLSPIDLPTSQGLSPVNDTPTLSTPLVEVPVPDTMQCPRCGVWTTDSGTIYRISSSSIHIPPGSPSVVAAGGPLDTAARVSGMSAVEELKLLKDQVQDVARVCNAVANGDLSQKITVDVRGEVMIKLKDAINTMVHSMTRRPPSFSNVY